MKISFEVWPNMPWGRLEAAGPAWNSWGNKPATWCVEQTAKYGYDGVDFIFAKLLEVPKAEYDQQLLDVRATAERVGIDIGYLGHHTTFVSPREFDRERGIESFKKALDAAAVLGAKSVCTLIGDGYYDPPLNVLLSRKDAWRQCREAITEVAAHASKLGLNVSIELLQGTILNRVELIERMFDEVGASNLRMTMDTGAFYVAVKPFMNVKQAIKRLGPYIDIVQIKDEVGLPTIVHCNHIWFGGGLVDFRETYEALAEINFDGYVSVEWEGWQVGGNIGVGEPAGVGLADFDRVAEESLEYLMEFGFVPRRSR
ncbi:sugar phosphate isomerase/epimerase family protein [Plantactinospora sp. KLBMP9567]|uniref:sugar phosphate isomerase/epimerase family protein n=1 Tax=Plantactinospora sp. KLBMP9567 TaxID=3085900 RepID=UPI0029829B0E|nr:sugar phosphate isomerase/epimerase family protein [Plantactinospora sp. KLBMP9567]MDW5325023.1 sugar phosphate isomerase/epimerase family protein [Plantactinospora sp. KLBMP9567]